MDCYDIFRRAFPDIKISGDIFRRLLDTDNCRIKEYRENGSLIGFTIISGAALRLICVAPEHRNKGIGKKLLKEAEDYIKALGYDSIFIGGVSSRLFIGAPCEAEGFFLGQGYENVGGCEEMTIDVQGFSSSEHKLPVPDNVTFGWYDGDFGRLKEAVADVDEEWVQYFSPEGRVFCGMMGDEIASFCEVDFDSECILSDGKNKVGVIGCVGTVHKYRKNGIGLKMVALATDELRKKGCDECFIHFTGVAPWYAKIGYRTFLKQCFLKKKL